jgi:hypothetical protein
MDKGTALIVVPQPGCPATLSYATHAASDYLESATLRNNSKSVLIGFRLGWMVAIPARKTAIHFGKRVSLKEGIKPNGTCTIPPQAANVDKRRTVPAVAAFFIAEVFLKGEQPWKADLEEVEDEVKGVTGN